MSKFDGVFARNPSNERRNLTIFNSHFQGGTIDGASITGESISNDSISNTTFFNGSINSTFIGVDSSNNASGQFPAAFSTTQITDTLTVSSDTTINGSLIVNGTNVNGSNASFTNASVTNGSLTNISGDNASYTNASLNTIINAGDINITPADGKKTVIKNASFSGSITGLPVLERKAVYMSASLSVSGLNTYVTYVHDNMGLLKDDYIAALGTSAILQSSINDKLKRYLCSYIPKCDGYIDYAELHTLPNTSNSCSLTINIHINDSTDLLSTIQSNAATGSVIATIGSGVNLLKNYFDIGDGKKSVENQHHSSGDSHSFTKDQEIMVTIKDSSGNDFNGYVMVILHVVLDTSTHPDSDASFTF
tara:strand:- start:132 stop:1223 length:1092 start_codon:yes stop_codon:yes gene_type:complete